MPDSATAQPLSPPPAQTQPEPRRLAEKLKAEADRLLLAVPRRVLKIATEIQQLGVLAEDPAVEALGVLTEADALRELGRYPDALREYDRAGELFLDADDEVGWARTRLGAAATRRYTVELGPALEEAERARSILRSQNQWLPLARLESTMGNLLCELGQAQEALLAHGRAAEAAGRVTSAEQRDVALAQIYINEAVVYQGLDEYEHAETLLRKGAGVARRYERSVFVSVAEGNLARGLAAQGHVSRALALATEVRRACLDLGRMSHAAIFGQVAVECLLELNRPGEAAILADEIVDQLRASDAGVELAKSLLQRAAARERLDRFTAAADDLAQAEVLFRTGGCAGWAAIVRLQHAQVLGRDDRLEAALREANDAALELRRRGLMVASARADLLGATLLGKLVRKPAARRAASAARSVARNHGVPLLEYQANRLLGELASTDRQALRAFAAAASALEKTQGRILTEQRSGFLQHDDKLTVFDSAIRLSLRAGDTRRAFEFAERAKTRALADALALRARGAGVRPRTAAARSLADELARLRRRYDRLSSTLLEPRPQGELGASVVADGGNVLQRELDDCQERITAVLDQLRLTEAASIEQLEALQGKLHSPLRHLGVQSVLIQFQILGDQIFVFVLRRGHAVQVRFAPAGATGEVVRLRRLLELNISTFNSGHRGPALEHQAKALLQRLYVSLIGPVEDLIHGFQRLIIVPHGALHAIPFGALHDGDGYLVERYELALAPSSSAVALCRRKRIVSTPRKTLVVAHSADGHLPGALAEGDTIASLFHATRLFEADATLENVRAELKDAAIVHIAAHGHSRPDAPLFSNIRLANGQLMAADCLELPLDCELVTLSACDTGYAVVAAGDEPIGLTRSLLYAGARSVIQSLWRVEDEATRWLMTDMYQRLRSGASRSEALRAAQRAFLEENTRQYRAHPACWAAFELMGDWRPIQ